MPTKKKAVVKKAKAVGTNNVMVGRFGTAPITVRVQKNATVKDVLAKADINLGTGERAWLNGSRATLTQKVSKGDIVSVVSPKEAGL